MNVRRKWSISNQRRPQRQFLMMSGKKSGVSSIKMVMKFGRSLKWKLGGSGVLNKTFFREDNRRKAIDFAINKLAKKGDWLLFLGKGHEKSMNVGGVETPWDEASIVRGSL